MRRAKKLGFLLAAGVCAISATFGLAACKGNSDTVEVVSGSSTTLKTDKAPTELSPENVIYAFLQKQSELKSYVITTQGEAVANIAGYRQDITNIIYKNGDDYLSQAQAESSLIHLKYQSFSKGGKVVYRDSFDGEMNVAEKTDYKKIYGFTADDITLGGYIINAKTLRYATLEEESGDTLTYYMRLAGDQSLEVGSTTESATAGVRLQAKAYGSLDNIPAFSDVDVHLTLKKDWTPVSYTSLCSYDCKRIINMSITQSLTCTYSQVNEMVEIPSVAQFNEKLGSEPSEIQPDTQETEPVMQLASAIGNSFDTNNTLTLPVSADIAVGESVKTLGGTLAFSLKQDGLNSGNYLDAFSFNLNLDISAVPLVSNFANALTLRYVGDGVLLLTLSNKTDNAENKLFSYPIDLKDRLAQADSTAFSPENLQEALHSFISLEKTGDGYKLSLTDIAVTKLNEAYTGLIAKLKVMAGDFIPSLLGLNFNGIEVEFTAQKIEAAEQITDIKMSVTTSPAERTGELIDFSLDVGLLSRSDMLSPFNGKLELRLNPSAVWSGNYYSLAQAHLNLDLKPAAPILGLVGTFAPAGSLPPFVGSALNNMDVYYTGDGVITLALNNAENAPLFVTQADLKTAQTATLAEEGQEEPGVSTLPPLEFKLEKKANGFIFTLGNPVAAIIDAAYQQLVKTAADYVVASAGGPESPWGGIAGQLVNNMLSATITNVELFVGTNDDGKLTVDFAIKGIPCYNSSGELVGEDAVEIRLLSLTLTENAPLTAEQQTALAAGKDTADKLLAQNIKDNATAADFAERLQPYIENIVLTDEGKDDYVAAVDALKEEFDNLPANVQTLISNASYMADTSYNGQTYSKLRVIYELYLARVNEFKELLPADDEYAAFNEWDRLNALYNNADNSHNFDFGVIVPAVKDSPEMKAAIGEARITAYIEARGAHEEDIARDLSDRIAASAAKYQSATDRQELTAALVEIIKDFKPTYNKLPEDKRALVTNYQEYVKTIYLKNIDGVTNAYNDIKQKLAGSDLTTADALLDTIKEFSEAYAWGAGYDYCSFSQIAIKEWGTWVSSLKPSNLIDDEQTKVSDFNTLQRSFMKGDFAKEIAAKYTQIIKDTVSELKTKIGDCKHVSETETTWNFETLGDEKATVLEKLHVLRFLIQDMLPADEATEIWGGDANLKAFADDLGNYETNLEKEIKAGA